MRAGNSAIDVPFVETEGHSVFYDAAGAPVYDFRFNRDELSLQHLVDANFLHQIRCGVS